MLLLMILRFDMITLPAIHDVAFQRACHAAMMLPLHTLPLRCCHITLILRAMPLFRQRRFQLMLSCHAVIDIIFPPHFV